MGYFTCGGPGSFTVIEDEGREGGQVIHSLTLKTLTAEIRENTLNTFK